MKNETIIGIDAGGTKISIGRVSAGRIVEEVCLPTNASGTEDEVIDNIIMGIERVMNSDVVGIGIGVPGLVDEQGGIVYNSANIPSWKEVHLKERLEKKFAKPVYVSNDANCFALGEKYFGKGQKYRNLVCLTIGTGVGAGLIINDQLHAGVLSVSGEFGCLPYLQHDFEYYCSGKFFSQCHQGTGKDFYERALAGDLKAIKVFDEYGAHLGNLVKTILLTIGPEAIILGGSVSNSYRFFQKSMMESVRQFPFKQIVNQLVIEVSVINRVSVLGAAAVYISRSETTLNNKSLHYERN